MDAWNTGAAQATRERTVARRVSRTARRRVLAVAAALLVSSLLTVDALAARPQGNVARAAPHTLAAGALVVVAAWFGWGRRAALAAGAAMVALASAAIAVYLVAVEPLPHAECGTLLEELPDATCVRGAPARLLDVAAAVGVGIAAVVVARRSSRTRRSRDEHAGA